MASDKQIAANRLNAQKSTGPRTPEGKRISSRNASRHGVLAQSILLEGESEERFRTLIAELHNTFRPTNRAETGFIESMAIASWRRMRFFTMEAVVCNHELEQFRGNPEFAQLTASTRCGLAFLSLNDRSGFLEMMHRYQESAERQYARAINGLGSLRKQTADVSRMLES